MEAESNDRCSLQCKVCGFVFRERKNLYAHMRNIHGHKKNQDSAPKKGSILCSVCGNLFSSNASLVKHKKNAHNIVQEKSRTCRIRCPICKSEHYSYNMLRSHLKVDHGKQIHCEELTFPSNKEFQEWRSSYQLENSASYVLDSSQKHLSCSGKLYFYCHRSHNYKAKGSNIRTLKKMGTNKIDAACPSTIEVLIKDGTYYVKFFPVHMGHDAEIERIPQHTSERAKLGVIMTGPELNHPGVQANDQGEEFHLEDKETCNDPVYGFKSEVKPEDSAAVCDPQEETFDVVEVKEEAELEIMKEESEDLAKSTLNTDEHETPLVNLASPQNCISAETPVSEASFDNHLYDKRKRRHVCDVCGKSFPRLSLLKNHTLIHTGEKPFKCDVCGKCFSRRWDIKEHLRTHSGDKPFVCHICGYCFLQSSHLKNHIRRHIGEKPFKCDVCGKCFLKSESLKYHVRIHTGDKPFTCDICGKCFCKRWDLKKHTLIHTGERPFKCNDCGKCFSQYTFLKRHFITHTGEKPFICDVCGYCFSTLASLKTHKSNLICKKSKK